MNALCVLDLTAVHERVLKFALACGDSVAAGIYGDVTAALANRRACDIHCRIARADDGDAVAEAIDIRILEIVYGVVAVAERFAVNTEALGPPCARPHKNRFITVTEEIIYTERAADGRVRTDMNADRAELFCVAVNG